jgi:hypothetical protein
MVMMIMMVMNGDANYDIDKYNKDNKKNLPSFGWRGSKGSPVISLLEELLQLVLPDLFYGSLNPNI